MNDSKTLQVLSYDGCGTCKKALKWMKGRGLEPELRPIVTAPPTVEELQRWIPKSGLPLRKWLNTSGRSYRELGREAVEAADEATLMKWLAADGKLVKRPVLVHGDKVLVGFREPEWEAHFG